MKFSVEFVLYSHLVIDDYKTTAMVNKDTSTWEHLWWIQIFPCVVYSYWIPWYIVIRRHYFPRQKIILLYICILDNIILGCINFISLNIVLTKLTGITLDILTIIQWLHNSLEFTLTFRITVQINHQHAGNKYVPVLSAIVVSIYVKKWGSGWPH